MTKWTCISCNEITLTPTSNEQPRFCSHCGNNRLVKIDARRQMDKFEDNKKEFAEIADKLNSLCEETKPIRKRYHKLMQYFRMKRARGPMTQEEFEEIAGLFKYGRDKRVTMS